MVTRRESLAHQIALTTAGATFASKMDSTKLAQAILALVKKGIYLKPPVAEAAISTLSQSKNTVIIQKVLDILAQSVKGPPVSTSCDPDSIGDAYFAGRKFGCVYGSPTIPNFKLKSSGTTVSTYRGWKLVPRPTSNSRMRFDFVKEIENNGPMNKNLSNSLVAIIKGQVKTSTVEKVFEKSQTANAIIALVTAIKRGHSTQVINKTVESSSSNNLVNKLTNLVKKGIFPSKNISNASGKSGIMGFFHKLFKGRSRFPTFGGFVVNPSTLIPQYINGVPVQWNRIRGYFIDFNGKIIRVFQKGNKLVSQDGHESQNVGVTQNAKSKISELISKIKVLAENALKTANEYLSALRESRRASNINKVAKNELARKARMATIEVARAEAEALAELQALYDKLFREGKSVNNFNVESISSYIYSSRFSGMSATSRIKKLAELYKHSKAGSKEREIIKNRMLEEIRNAGQNREPGVAMRRLQNLKTNFGSLNRNLERAFGVELARARENMNNDGRSRNKGRRRYGNEGRMRYGNEGRMRYGNEGRMRYGNEGRRRYGNEGRMRYGNEGRRRYGNEGSESILRANSLPMNEKNAITNAGGVTSALNTIASVPGGAREVAKAAVSINEKRETNVSPVAIQAVQKLGGSKKALIVINGLNTISKKTHSKKKRKSPLKIRVAELNKVINAVKKKKLISLVAHNVTKTHNLHPNDEKKKKYYKRVIKSNILRTKFSKIIKRAARKG